MPASNQPRTSCLAAVEPESTDLVQRFRAARSPSVVTIGTFDGVHRGHQALVGAARHLARNRGLRVIAITFSPRPEMLFRPTTALPDICSLDERISGLRKAGADQVVVVPFSREICVMEDDEFIDLLTTHLDMRALYVGEDFALGRGRRGTPERLRELGVDVHEHPLVPNAIGNDKASSSAVRQAIASGAVLVEALDAA